MSVESFERITPDNLEAFLTYHKSNPLPEWFPMDRYNDCEKQDFNDGLIQITDEKLHNYGHGITVLPYIKGHLSYIEASNIVISYPFTGCYMAAFSFPRSSMPNVKYVCHIANDSGKGDNLLYLYLKSEETKGNMIIFCVFDPFDEILKKKIISIDCEKFQTYGIILPDNTAYWVYTGFLKSDRKRHIIDWGKVEI